MRSSTLHSPKVSKGTLNWEKFISQKIVPPENINDTVKYCRDQRFTIATLNGSFDLLHAGHLYIIYEAYCQADFLIVALNTDESIKSYKGPSKPIIPLKYRLQHIASLEFVNAVTWFSEPDPRQLLSQIKPDVHVNGAEYGENCIEAQIIKKNGGALYLVEKIDGLSSTKIQEKIRAIT